MLKIILDGPGPKDCHVLKSYISNHFQNLQVDTELGEMQKMFMNFSQQMFTLEQWHMSARTHYNTTSQNQGEITEIQLHLDNQRNRIKSLEDLVQDSRYVCHTCVIRDTQHHLPFVNEYLGSN